MLEAMRYGYPRSLRQKMACRSVGVAGTILRFHSSLCRRPCRSSPCSLLDAAPFALLLLGIALLPIVAGHWWHSDWNKAIIGGVFSFPVIGFLIGVGPTTNDESTHQLLHELEEFSSFIILLAALYTISGGILISGAIPAHPRTNTLLLAIGAVLANFIGTTGASMVLIRPILRINVHRRHNCAFADLFYFHRQ